MGKQQKEANKDIGIMKKKINPEPKYVSQIQRLFFQKEILDRDIRIASEMILRSCGITDMQKGLGIDPSSMSFFIIENDGPEIEGELPPSLPGPHGPRDPPVKSNDNGVL